MTQRAANWLTSMAMIALGCIIALPFYYIVVNAFKSQADMTLDPLAPPKSLYLDNFSQAFGQSDIPRAFLNTVYVTGVSVALMLLIGSMAAFALIYRTSKLNTVISVILLSAFVVPYQSTIIPLYQLIVNAGYADNLQGLIAVYLAGSVFCYFLIQGYMRSVPLEIVEAARIDGAGPFRIFWQIVLPLIRPVLITVGVFQVMWVWNDYISPTIFLSSPQNNTLVLLASQAVAQFTTNWPLFMAVSVLALTPMLIFFVAVQKHIVNGLLSGGVKG